MASFVVKSSFCLFVAFFCLALGVEAREGKLFFSKFTHLGANKDVGPSPRPSVVSPARAPAPGPGPAQVDGRLGDGHFGPGSGMIPQTKESWPVESTTSDEEFEKLMDKFDEETDKVGAGNSVNDKLTEDFEEEEGSEDSVDPSEQKSKYYDDDDNNNNGYTFTDASSYMSDTNNDKVRGYGEERQGMSDTRFMEKGRNYENTPTTTTSNYERSNYNGNASGYGEDGQEKSATGFMEKGKYFYDVNEGNDENTPSRYEGGDSAPENSHPNEFDTMEEYYKSSEGLEESMP